MKKFIIAATIVPLLSGCVANYPADGKGPDDRVGYYDRYDRYGYYPHGDRYYDRYDRYYFDQGDRYRPRDGYRTETWKGNQTRDTFRGEYHQDGY